MHGRLHRLLLLLLLPSTLLGQDCELAGLAVPAHGVVNEFCVTGVVVDTVPSRRLPDGEGCYIGCEPGWIESGDQPQCSGGVLSGSVACSPLLLPCLRSLPCLRRKDRGCFNRYEDEQGRGTCSTHQTLTAASCATDFCRTCDSDAVPACGPCAYKDYCDAACESLTPLAPGVSFCVPDDETVEISATRHFSFRHYDTRGVSSEVLRSAASAAFSDDGGDDFDGGVLMLATQQRLTVVVEIGRRGWAGAEGIASYSADATALVEAQTACALADGLAEFAGLPPPATRGRFAALAGDDGAAASVLARNETGGTLTLSGSLLTSSATGGLLADRQLYPQVVLALRLALGLSDTETLQVPTPVHPCALLCSVRRQRLCTTVSTSVSSLLGTCGQVLRAGVTSVGVGSATITIQVPTRMEASAAAGLGSEIECGRPVHIFWRADMTQLAAFVSLPGLTLFPMWVYFAVKKLSGSTQHLASR
jgi:hypothetical protein